VQYDLGLTGLGILVGISLLFGIVAQLVLGGGTRWMWLIAAAGWFVGGLVFSEAVFSWATVDDLQPMIDGLLLDESLLGGLLVGVPVALVTWLLTRQRQVHRPTTP
jgi:hypothetical protein